MYTDTPGLLLDQEKSNLILRFDNLILEKKKRKRKKEKRKKEKKKKSEEPSYS